MTQFLLLATLIFYSNFINTMQEETKLTLREYYCKAQPELMKLFFTLPQEIQCSTLIDHLSPQQQLWFEKKRFQHDNRVNSAQFNNDLTLEPTASNDNTARVFARQPRHEVQRFQQNRWITSAKFNNNETLVLTASYDNTARIFDRQSGDELHRLQHDNWVISAQFNNDSSLVLTTSGDNIARIWGPYTTWTPDQLLLYKLLFTWLLVQKTDKEIKNIQEFISSTCIYQKIDQQNITEIYATFPEPVQKVLWEKIKLFIQKYGK